MKRYRGLPHPSKLHKEHCEDKGKSQDYDQKKCQMALADLMLYGRENLLKKKFGKRIMECFNKSDLDRFLKESNARLQGADD